MTKPITCRRTVEVLAFRNPEEYNSPDRAKIVEWIESISHGNDAFVNGQTITWYEGDYPCHLDVGDWLVLYNGDLLTYSDEEFQQTFTPYNAEEEIDRAISKLQAI